MRLVIKQQIISRRKRDIVCERAPQTKSSCCVIYGFFPVCSIFLCILLCFVHKWWRLRLITHLADFLGRLLITLSFLMWRNFYVFGISIQNLKDISSNLNDQDQCLFLIFDRKRLFFNSSKTNQEQPVDYRANSSYSGRTANTETTEVWTACTTDPKGTSHLRFIITQIESK